MMWKQGLRALGLVLCSHGLLLAAVLPTRSQPQYFPPIGDSTWATVSLQELGWCTSELDTLYSFLTATNSKAFIVLKGGRIAIEWYADGFTKYDNWYWASAGKTVTATLVGIAQREGKLDIRQPSSTYQGTGWTSLPLTQEQAITVWHQLTMTSGLDDGAGDPFCTDPACLVYKADPGTRWAYHNAPYTLLDAVITGATGQALNTYFTQKLKSSTGMDGLFVKSGYNNILMSTPRSMARFGLLALRGFVWNGVPILDDPTYVEEMVNTSQELNKSYGYLWWLNGKESFMLPGVQFVFKGPMTPNAPPDMYSGLGKNDQIVSAIPSEDLVVVRMGDNPTTEGQDVPTVFLNDVWRLLRNVMCTTLHVDGDSWKELEGGLDNAVPQSTVVVFDVVGRILHTYPSVSEARTAGIDAHRYLIREVSAEANAGSIVYALQLR